ncbi:MAG: hypothetical protein AAFQ83_12810 [Bacteroidota bacterium]
MKFLVLTSLCFSLLFAQHSSQEGSDPSLLIGTWQLDMTPQDITDDNFAMMRIRRVDDKGFYGTFYRKGVKIREGRFNTQRGILYGALVSGDNSGDYNTTFFLKEGILYGSTHSLQRDFLAVWTAIKVSDS